MVTKRLIGITRLKNSRSGNPRYELVFADAVVASTTPDSDYAFEIGNPGVRVGDLVDVEFQGGRVARIQAASVAS